ncbi:MAG: hypothetical protein NZ853_06745 [Leptospiraceae bacterium]|nr:hypothetical protein [Leptospiraceae bacterium]MDW7975869.1 hypothetical protein [Leptospiraceae bacterium]
MRLLIILLFFYSFILYSQQIFENKSGQTNTFSENYISSQIELFQKGEEYFFKKQYQTAKLFFEKLISINPDHPYAHSYLGDIYLYLDDPKKALEHSLIAKELLQNQNKTNQTKIHPIRELFRIAQLYYLLNQLEKSQKYCNEILKLEPKFHQCFFYLGLIEIQLYKNREKAIENLKKYQTFLQNQALQNPELYQKELQNVQLLIQKLEFKDENSLTLKKVLDPLNLIRTENQPYKPKKLEDLPTISQMDLDTLPELEQNLWHEYFYFKTKEPQKAKEILLKIEKNKKKSRKENFLLRKYLCFHYYQDQAYIEAERECKEALSYELDKEILAYLSNIYYNQKDFEAFEDTIYQWLEIDKDNPNALYLYASYLFERNRLKEALHYNSKNLYQNPSHKDALLLQLSIYKELKEHDLLKSVLKKLYLYHKEDIQILRIIAYSYLEIHEWKESESILKEIYQKTKKVEDGLLLISSYLQQDAYDEKKVLEIFSELYAQYPTHQQLVKSIILYFKEKNTNFDTIKTIAEKFIESEEDLSKKKEIFDILPNEIQKEIQNEISPNFLKPEEKPLNLENERQKLQNVLDK